MAKKASPEKFCKKDIKKATKAVKKAFKLSKKEVKKTNKLQKKYNKLQKKANKKNSARKLDKAQLLLEKLNDMKVECEGAFAALDDALVNLANCYTALVVARKTEKKSFKDAKTKSAKVQAAYAEKKAKLARRLVTKKGEKVEVEFKPLKKDVKKTKAAVKKALKACKKDVKKANKFAKKARKAQKRADKKLSSKKRAKKANAMAAAVKNAIERYKKDARNVNVLVANQHGNVSALAAARLTKKKGIRRLRVSEVKAACKAEAKIMKLTKSLRVV